MVYYHKSASREIKRAVVETIDTHLSASFPCTAGDIGENCWITLFSIKTISSQEKECSHAFL